MVMIRMPRFIGAHGSSDRLDGLFRPQMTCLTLTQSLKTLAQQAKPHITCTSSLFTHAATIADPAGDWTKRDAKERRLRLEIPSTPCREHGGHQSLSHRVVVCVVA